MFDFNREHILQALHRNRETVLNELRRMPLSDYSEAAVVAWKFTHIGAVEFCESQHWITAEERISFTKQLTDAIDKLRAED